MKLGTPKCRFWAKLQQCLRIASIETTTSLRLVYTPNYREVLLPEKALDYTNILGHASDILLGFVKSLELLWIETVAAFTTLQFAFDLDSPSTNLWGSISALSVIQSSFLIHGLRTMEDNMLWVLGCSDLRGTAEIFIEPQAMRRTVPGGNSSLDDRR